MAGRFQESEDRRTSESFRNQNYDNEKETEDMRMEASV